MTSISGIEIYPLISFVIFFAFFIGVTWYIFATRKEYFNMLSQLPLDNDVKSDAKDCN
jgi:cbb3-type cytochrome oxidase subunit 3